jgi:hypothetical protein
MLILKRSDRKSLEIKKYYYKEYSINQMIITDRFGQGTFTYNQNLDKFD